jgi:signal transduction histidine kinase
MGSVENTHGQGQPRRLGEGWSLARRLLVPTTVLAASFCILASVLLVRTISSRMDRALDSRLAGLADSLEVSGFALEDEMLTRIRSVTAAEVVTLAPDGEPLASTLDPAAARRLVEGVDLAAGEPGLATVDGSRFRTLVRSIEAPAGNGLTLLVAASTGPTDRLKRELTLMTVFGTAAALALVIVIGRMVVNTATRPLARLAEAAREVARGDLERRVPVGGGQEVEALANEFNSMVDDLARSREELLAAEKLAVAGRMAASVAHEIRNPLSSVRMTLQLLERQTAADGGARRDVQEVLSEIDRLDLTLSNLLDLTRTPAVALALEPVNPIVEGTLRITARRLEHLGVKVEADLAGDLPAIRIDAHKARQVFMNVLLNAVEAMPGGGTVRVRTHLEGPFVQVDFEDDGPGIADELSEKIFDPFFSTKTHGAGLGLHIVRSIMESHGGRVSIEPRTAGTHCALRFPVPGGAPGESEPLDDRRTA